MKCNNLRKYINKFKKLLAQYETVDGERESENIIADFIENIASSRYLAQKTMFDAKNDDEAFDFFRKIADKEAIYDPQLQINNSSNAARFPSASS